MRPYLDSNFATALYLATGFESQAEECFHAARAKGAGLPTITELVEIEVTNAIQFHVFATRNGGPLRITPENAGAAFARFEEDVAGGYLYNLESVDWMQLRKEATELSLRHTARHGFRTYDLIHVTSALILECNSFWSFDLKARKLAQLEGLTLNPLA